jgi:transposase
MSGISPRIARKGAESSEKLGRRRWIVERTLAWLNQFRRLVIRYDRKCGHSQGYSAHRLRSYLLESSQMRI